MQCVILNETGNMMHSLRVTAKAFGKPMAVHLL